MLSSVSSSSWSWVKENVPINQFSFEELINRPRWWFSQGLWFFKNMGLLISSKILNAIHVIQIVCSFFSDMRSLHIYRTMRHIKTARSYHYTYYNSSNIWHQTTQRYSRRALVKYQGRFYLTKTWIVIFWITVKYQMDFYHATARAIKTGSMVHSTYLLLRPVITHMRIILK